MSGFVGTVRTKNPRILFWVTITIINIIMFFCRCDFSIWKRSDNYKRACVCNDLFAANIRTSRSSGKWESVRKIHSDLCT